MRFCHSCLCYALRRWWPVRREGWLAIRMSRHIPGVPHVVFVPSLEGVPIEEAVPVGAKRRGLSGVRHALTAEWTVRKGKGDP